MPIRRSDADRLAHVIDVGADQLADVRDLVHERDARRQNRVRRVLAQLGARRVHHQDRRAGARERRVQLLHDRRRALVVRLDADHDAIRLHEVFDRGALLQELGVADDAERLRRFARRSRRGPSAPCRPARCSCRRRPCICSSRGRCRAPPRARAAGRPTPSSPCGVPTAMNTISEASHRGRQVGRERQPLFVLVAPNHLLEARLVDRHLARRRSIAIFDSSLSTHTTVFPFSARQAPRTRPTYPVPTTAIFISQ